MDKLRVAWISDFPLEWLPDLPAEVAQLPRRHPATWQIVLLEEFARDPSIDLHIYLLRHRLDQGVRFKNCGAEFHVLKGQPWLRLASLFWLDTILIGRALKKNPVDIVHAWGSEKGAGIIAHRLRRPYVMTVQGLYAWYKQRLPLARYDRFCEVLERKTFRQAPLVTTESKFAVKFLAKNFPRLAVQQAEHAPNKAFAAVQRRPQLSPLRFITVGGLGYRKGTDILFSVLDELTPSLDWQLDVVTGPSSQYIAQLKTSVSEATWSRVHFKHHILPHEVARELETAAMLLLPTRADTSPNAVKEAAVAGVPVVASDIGGIPDYIIPGRNGILSPPGDRDAFKKALQDACRHELFRKGTVDPVTLAQTRDYLSPARMAQNFKKAYRTLLG